MISHVIDEQYLPDFSEHTSAVERREDNVVALTSDHLHLTGHDDVHLSSDLALHEPSNESATRCKYRYKYFRDEFQRVSP